MQYVAGLLEHAVPSLPFASPTVTGYKRYRPYSFAPDRVCWAVENRGALVRVQGAPGDTSSHVEMRSGEPAANPYLYMAANIAAGLDGITRGLTPPAPVEADPYSTEAPPLPTSLADAVQALDDDSFYRKAFGDTLIDYLVMLKRSEIKRYEEALTESGADPRRRLRRHRLGDARVLRVLLSIPVHRALTWAAGPGGVIGLPSLPPLFRQSAPGGPLRPGPGQASTPARCTGPP